MKIEANDSNDDLYFLEANNQKFAQWKKNLKLNTVFFGALAIFLWLMMYIRIIVSSSPIASPYKLLLLFVSALFTLIPIGFIVRTILYNKGLRITISGLIIQDWLGRDKNINFMDIVKINEFFGKVSVEYTRNNNKYRANFNYSRIDSPATIRKLLKEKVGNYTLAFTHDNF